MIWRIVVGACAAIAIPGEVLSAQGAVGRSTPQVGADEIRIVLVAVVSQLPEEVANGALSPTSRPWTIQVPDSSSTLWQTLRNGLYAVLHARQVTAADSSYTSLTVGPVTLRGDTLSASFGVVQYGYCQASPNLVIGSPGLNAGSSSGYRFTSIRQSGYWLAPKFGSVSVVDGGCMYKGKP